jgi:hypothetical protein
MSARYYRPYDSESDSESECSALSSGSTDYESDSDSSVSSSCSRDFKVDGPNYRLFASQLQLIKTAGPSFSTIQQELFYQKPSILPNGLYSDFARAFDAIDPRKVPPPPKEGFADTTTSTTPATKPSPLNPETSLAATLLPPIPTKTEKVNTIVLLNSRDRDRQVYPQPTSIKLKLPREYRNITNFQIMQVSLLTSFYYFRQDKANLDITIQELDRTFIDSNGLTQPLKIKNTIRQGSYNINSLLTEISKWLNNVPIFFDYINGFSDFQAAFQASGDFGVNFNEPGDYFFDTVQNDFIANPTKDLIVSKYWKNRFSDISIFTVNQVRVAYYYPVLKEILQDADYPNAINLETGLGIDPTITTTQDVYDRILYTFQGIDDPVVLAVINGNQPALDNYRVKHTFRYFLVNKYTPTLEAQSQQVVFTTTSLNTSLVNLLNIKQAEYYAQQFQQAGITSNQFVTLQTATNQLRAIIQQMNAFEQSNLATYFAVPFNTYSLDYFANLRNTISIRNGIGAVGIPTGYSDPYYNPLTAPLPISNDILQPLKQEPPVQWPNMTLLTDTIDYFSASNDTINHPYSVTKSNILLDTPAIHISTNQFVPFLKGKYLDVLTHISASHYTVFPFTSPVRQTLQVETLFRPQEYRIPDYNKLNYNSTIQKYFDTTYAFVSSPYTAPEPYKFQYDVIPDSDIQTICPLQWADSYSTSLAYISTPYQLTINTSNKENRLQFTTPDTFTYNHTTSTLRYPLTLSIESYDASGQTLSPPKQPLRILFYKDRSAFMGDVYRNRSEIPYSIYASTILDTTSTTLQTQFTVYPNQTFYCIARPDPISFGSIQYRIIPYFSTGFESSIESIALGLDGINPATDSQYNSSTLSNFNYAQMYDQNYLPLPLLSTLALPNPSLDSNQTTLLTSNVAIGYDLSGVSNDYTDYMPFLVSKSTNFTPYNVNIGIDPINEYQFEALSPYSQDSSSWFYPGSSNAILIKKLLDVYSSVTTIPHRQEKIVHYYSLNYLLSAFDVDHYASSIYTSPVQQPYSQYSTDGSNLRGYEYSSNVLGNSTNTEYLSLGQGPCGFSFIPGEGIWDIDKIVLRSAFYKSSNDPNQAIRFLGVYNLQDIYDQQTKDIQLRSSILILSNTSNRTYDPTNIFSLSAGFDYTGGTYYEFQKISSIATHNTNSTINGYDQDQGTMTNDTTNLYSIIAFDSNERPTTIKALSGSLVPFPYYNTATPSTTYLDGTRPPLSNFFDLIVPTSTSQTVFPLPGGQASNYAPPTGYDGSQSIWQLSKPLGTSVTHYIDTKQIVNDVSGIFSYDLPFQANAMVTTVKDYIMTQTSVFQIWYYPQTGRNLTLAWDLTGDLVYPSEENTALLGIAGNTTEFVFLGAQSNSPTDLSLRFKKFNPVTGLLQDYFTPSTFTIPNSFTLNTFTFTNTNAFTIAGNLDESNAVLYRSLDGSNLEQYSLTDPTGIHIHHSQDVSSNVFYWLKQDSNYLGSTFYQVLDTDTFPGREFNIIPQPGGTLPSTFRTLSMALFRGQPYETAIDEIILTTLQSTFTNYFYSVYQLNSNQSTATTLQSVVQFSNVDVSGAPLLSGLFSASGYNSSRWFMTDGYPYLWANRNNATDRLARVESAWQIFYPWQKIVLKQIANSVNPITDLTGLGEPEYPHTRMFYYTNGTSMSNDIATQWGLERSTNFEVANVNFAGYAFNSYIFDVPLRASSSPSDLQYLALRNYLPTEESQVLTRFVLKNKYTFGYLTFSNIAEEANLFKAGTSNSLFDPIYANVLSKFDTAFSTTKSWGSNLLPGFNGCNLSFSNFGGFISAYSNFYQLYASNVNIINSILSTVRGDVNNYIQTQLKYILPPSALSRQGITDPLQYSILWKSALQQQQLILTENWGLGYNLGFVKEDTPYGTVQRAQSFYKIIDDYIYLRLNPEYNMNRLDFGGRENYSITLETTGATKTYYGKLLLNNFNTVSQTFVQNPIPFNPALPRLDQLSFDWVEFAGNVINNNDCDWNVSIQITEEVTKFDTAQSSGV